MAITYNDLFLDIRRELKQGGVIDTTLEARELIKGTVQQNCDLSAKEALEALCEMVHAEPVQCIGRRFVLYRRSRQPKIELP